MDWKTEVLNFLLKERELVDRAWEAAKLARDQAQTPTESYSDQTRSQQEKLAFALEFRLWDLDKYIKEIKNAEVRYMEHNGMKLVLVPEGMGGKKIGDVTMVSVTSPLGRKLSEMGN